MNNFAIAALTVVALMGYGAVIVWYIALRRRQDGIEERVRVKVFGPAAKRGTDEIIRRNLDRKIQERISSYQRMERIIGVDSYEALYYPVPQWVIILGAVGAAIGVETFCWIVFGYSFLFYETILPFVALYFCRRFFNHFHDKRRTKLFLQLPAILDNIVRSVRAGSSVSKALRIAASDAPEPTGTEFRKMTEDIDVGVTAHQAMRTLADNNKIPEYHFLAIAVSLQTTAGGAIGETLENVARVVRGRVQIRQRGHALTGEARGSAAILTALPIVVILALAAITPHYVMKLFVTQTGRHYFGISTVLLLFGRTIMTRMIRGTLKAVR